jgi:hypothetical protein
MHLTMAVQWKGGEDNNNNNNNERIRQLLQQQQWCDQSASRAHPSASHPSTVWLFCPLKPCLFTSWSCKVVHQPILYPLSSFSYISI